MKTTLRLNFKLLVTLCLSVFFLVPIFAQQPTIEEDPSQNPQKGHKLYKQSKIYDSKTGAIESKPKAVGDKAQDRMEYEFNMLKNPYTGEIPANIRNKELKFASGIELAPTDDNAMSRGNFSNWKSRGPFNVGGRTRALAIDVTNENVILAGGVSGGLYRSTNGGQTWREATNDRQAPSISAIAQDTRRNKTNTWYYATGERIGNSASAGGAFYTGTGVYKSMNGGRTWRLLESTSDNDIRFASPFDIVSSIAVHPINGDVYLGTIDGIWRSQDGGDTFEEVLEGGFDNFTEVMITPSGRIYATIAAGGTPNAGWFTSTNGDTWTNITPAGLPPTYSRTVLTYDPSDENTIWFFARNLSPFSEAFLWKYDADAATEAELWADLSVNLPTSIGGPVGNLNLQTGYNMIVKVHPTNSDMVFVAGTNLYRSMDGFSTQVGQESWIGGYSPINNVSVYPDNHPDQHVLLFFPSNPNKALNGTDGGVHITEDITTSLSAAVPVEWTDLNNGYLSTQPYAVAFDPEANSDDLVAGFQDNGTWFTNSTASNAIWEEDFGGDGAYNAIADGGLTRYVSSQRGNLYRLNFDEDGEFISFTRVRPSIVNTFSFITPFVLDPNNDNVMYLPSGNQMLRNNNLDEIPLFSNSATPVNWVILGQTATPDGSTITSLDVSTYPVANRLYYGTNSGGIYRMDNANLDNQPVVDISTGKGLPIGNVNNVYVDPSNADRVFAVFSNYTIPSIFMSTDAGETWTDISGNLEENPDGSGNGPSVRWIAVKGKDEGLYAATSTGLYTTSRINGSNTRWNQERVQIGNAVVAQVRTRKDGFVAAASHGNGLYSARFPVRERPELSLTANFLLSDTLVPLNSEDVVVDITGLFSGGPAPITVELTNSNPSLVTATLSGNTLTLSYTADAEGSATIGLIATSGEEQVAEGFTTTVTEFAIYEQIDPRISSSPSQLFVDFGGALVQSSDDFVIPSGNTWTIDKVLAAGGANGAPTFTSATVVIYADAGGLPGAEIYNSGALVPASAATDTNLTLELPEAQVLESGTYWLSVYAILPFNPGGRQWFWNTQSAVVGNEAAFRDPVNLFGTGALDWTPQSGAFTTRPPRDHIFQIFGVVEEAGTTGGGTESNDPELLATVDGNAKTLVWPNPSGSDFNFRLNSNTDSNLTARIYSITGQLIYEKANLAPGTSFNWNAATNPAGFYIVNISGTNTNEQFKIIKR
ncbi:T9SS type A sorting domain-containing protein [Ascidiimonas sp. W6]|uniref:T9SS type A sorting domain-containing protein n=1 Tax=Ascidiimonas meishanensis TaxID=3128903 RepID=UPI0030EE3053